VCLTVFSLKSEFLGFEWVVCVMIKICIDARMHAYAHMSESGFFLKKNRFFS
jgi:hypothetical protein